VPWLLSQVRESPVPDKAQSLQIGEQVIAIGACQASRISAKRRRCVGARGMFPYLGCGCEIGKCVRARIDNRAAFVDVLVYSGPGAD